MHKFYKFTNVNGHQFLIKGSSIIDVVSHVDSEISTLSYLSHEDVEVFVRSFQVDMTIDEVFDYLNS